MALQETPPGEAFTVKKGKRDAAFIMAEAEYIGADLCALFFDGAPEIYDVGFIAHARQVYLWASAMPADPDRLVTITKNAGFTTVYVVLVYKTWDITTGREVRAAAASSSTHIFSSTASQLSSAMTELTQMRAIVRKNTLTENIPPTGTRLEALRTASHERTLDL